MSHDLAALERRGDELEAFHNAARQANEYIAKDGSQALVDELRRAREAQRRMKIGTINTLVLLHHIDRLEAALANEGVSLP